jgi:NTE family protein
MKKFGYVLSGGGVRGFAHLGLLKFLEELHIQPYAISGTSAGAIVGVLYAAGKTPEEILELMKKNNLFGWGNIIWNKSGFFSMKTLKKVLKDTIKEDDFEAVKIKLFVATTDLNNNEVVYLSKGELFKAVIASASIPVLFEPVTMGDKILIDGGLLNNLPVEPLEDICDVIIGSYVNKVEGGVGNASFFKPFNILERCFHLAIARSVYSKVHKCHVFIEASLHDFDMYGVKQADQIFEIGYETALKHKDELLKFTDEMSLSEQGQNLPKNSLNKSLIEFLKNE